MRIVITGGGTGGHIYPALAVAECLRDDPSVESILYVGNRNSIEAQLVPENGFAFESIVFTGMPRKPGLKWIQWLLSLNRAVGDARRILIAQRPNVVFGTGGYVSAPVLLAALQLKIPYIIHEPDAMPGLVNRLMARWADQATGAFQASGQRLKAKRFQATGNPIRGNIQTLYDPAQRLSRAEALQQLGLDSFDPQRPILLVVGGSQGARTLNQAVAGALPRLVEALGLQVIHQTGPKLYDEAVAALDERFKQHPAYRVQPYYPSMWLALAASDLAVCRAGSLTLSEMYLAGLPTILVPYPFAAADHQRKNAQASVEAGASLMLEDADCSTDTLVQAVQDLVANPARLEAMRSACRTLAHPEATQQIVALLKTYASPLSNRSRIP